MYVHVQTLIGLKCPREMTSSLIIVPDTHDDSVISDWLKEFMVTTISEATTVANFIHLFFIFPLFFHLLIKTKNYIIFQALYCKSATTGQGCVKAINDNSILYVYESCGASLVYHSCGFVDPNGC